MTGRPRRTPEQIRLSTAHHEAAHAVAAYLLGQRFEKIEVVRLGEVREQGDVAGCVRPEPQSISDIHAAEDRTPTPFRAPDPKSGCVGPDCPTLVGSSYSCRSNPVSHLGRFCGDHPQPAETVASVLPNQVLAQDPRQRKGRA